MASYWNRAGRRSGGNRPVKIYVSGNPHRTTGKLVGLLCAYGFHEKCESITDRGNCECECHKQVEVTTDGDLC